MPRTLEAQQFHSQIIQFINGDLESIDSLVQKISTENDRGFILETSVNGHSHLMDVLHLSFAIPNSLGKTPSEIAHLLFDLFKSQTTPDEWQELLFKPCNRSFYPLQQAVMSKDFKLYKKCEEAYLDILKNKSGVEYKKLLIKLINMLITNNDEGYNSLHSAIASNSEEILDSFLNLLQKLHSQLNQIKLVREYELLDILLIADDYQNNPVHIAIFHQNNLVLKKIILRLFATCPTQKISLLHSALNQLNSSNLNLLMNAVVRQDLSCLKTIFNLLKSENFSRPIYKQILLSQHQSSYSPLHLVLKTDKKEILELFYKHLNEACENKLISEEELAFVFLKNGNLNFPLLFNALLASPEVFEYYILCINELIDRRIISRKEWDIVLSYQDYSYKSLWILALEANAPASNLSIYLQMLQKLLTKTTELETLVDLGILGFDVLEKILKHQDLDLFKLYFDYVIDSLTKHNLSFSYHELFYSAKHQTILNSLCSCENPEFVSYFFSKLDNKTKHLPDIIASSQKSNSAFYQLLHGNAEALQIFFKETKSYLSADTFQKLLTQTPNDFSQPPAFHVLENTNALSIELYFDELEKILTPNEQFALFLPKNEESILVYCLKKGSAQATKYLCHYLTKLPIKEQGLLFDTIDYQTLFNHHATISIQFFHKYLIFIEQLMLSPKVYENKIKSALLPRDYHTKTLLNRIIEVKEFLLLEQYFNLLSKAIELKIISRDEYKNMMLSTNYQFLRPINLAVASKNDDIFLFYWKRLSSILKKGDEFSEYVQDSNLIASVSYTACLEMTKVVYKSLEKLFENQPKVLNKLFKQSNFHLVLTNHASREEASDCLAYLEKKQIKLEKKCTLSTGFFSQLEECHNHKFRYKL